MENSNQQPAVMAAELDAPMVKRKTIHEDWVVVILGFLVILLALAGLKSAVPAYKWSGIDDLTGKVFSSMNLLSIALQFVFVFVIAVLGAWLTGRPIRNFIVMFPVVYLIAVIAMVLTGNAQVEALNLEAVIFSLTLGLILGNFFQWPQWFREVLSPELFVKIGLV